MAESYSSRVFCEVPVEWAHYSAERKAAVGIGKNDSH